MNTHLRARLVAAVVVLVAAGCGSSDDASGGASSASSSSASSTASSSASSSAGSTASSSTAGSTASSSSAGSTASSSTAGSTASSSTAGSTGSSASSSSAGSSSGSSSSSGSTSGSGGALTLYGQPYTGGQFHLGPVDYAETQFHNACAPGSKYPASVQQVEGTLLAGLWNGIPDVASYCDACIQMTTAAGRSAILRVVTFGVTQPNSVDTSPEAYALLNQGEYPRSMTWQFVKCPDSGPMIYEFQDDSSQWWTSLWVRNARVPITRVEVRSPNHPSYAALSRGSDGTLTDGAGFGHGDFTLRITGIDGQQVEESFTWPSSGLGGWMVTGSSNFQ